MLKESMASSEEGLPLQLCGRGTKLWTYRSLWQAAQCGCRWSGAECPKTIWLPRKAKFLSGCSKERSHQPWHRYRDQCPRRRKDTGSLRCCAPKPSAYRIPCLRGQILSLGPGEQSVGTESGITLESSPQPLGKVLVLCLEEGPAEDHPDGSS